MKWFKRLMDSASRSSGATRGHPCSCRRPPFRHTDYDTKHIGEDRHGADAAVATCKACGSVWLTYFIEEPHYSRSGRWWRVELPTDALKEVSAASARALIERSAEGFAGGSFFNSQGHAITAPIRVR